jgi:hypothetical protein
MASDTGLMCVGGPLDGCIRAGSNPHQQYLTAYPEREFYRREMLRTGQQSYYVWVAAGVTIDDALQRLLAHYRPEGAHG